MHKCPKNKSIIRNGKIYTGCDECINSLVQGSETSAKNSRDKMRRDYAKDIVQLSEPRDFIKAHGIENARQYYSDDVIRKYS